MSSSRQDHLFKEGVRAAAQLKDAAAVAAGFLAGLLDVEPEPPPITSDAEPITGVGAFGEAEGLVGARFATPQPTDAWDNQRF